MECNTTSASKRRRCRGFTFIEFLVAGSLGVLVAGAVVMFSSFSSRSLVAMSNHLDLNEQARRTLDRMTQDIRQCTAVTAWTTNSITLTDYDGKSLSFAHNPVTQTLTRTMDGSSTVLLTECTELNLQLFQRDPQTLTFDLFATTDPALCKAVRVTWRCVRIFVHSKVTAENTTSATIVLRMK